MKNVLILGASGNIAKHVIDMLVQKDEVNLTLFLRNKNRLRKRNNMQKGVLNNGVGMPILEYGVYQ